MAEMTADARMDRAERRTIPPLAWLCAMTPGRPPRVQHGSSVRVLTDGIVEGVFAGYDLARSPAVFGSGLRLYPDHAVFVAASHTLEGLYVYRHEGGITISNSLSFLVENHGLQLPWLPSYGRIFATSVRGADSYEPTIARLRRGILSRFLCDNLVIHRDGRSALVRKTERKFMPTYPSYIESISSTLSDIIKQASDYRPLATVSTGYDSAACAVLAARYGCAEALTLRLARLGNPDSGVEVGRLLGMEVMELERPERVRGAVDEVAPFLATGAGGEDYCYREFVPCLKRRLLLTGFHGDFVWSLHHAPSATIARGDMSGASLQEVRLLHDFIHVPVPMIGTRQHTDILTISRSAEMAPFRLGTDYDRPIPRRLLEEVGVPRHVFGQRKNAASLPLFKDPTLWSPELRQAVTDLTRRLTLTQRTGYYARMAMRRHPWGFVSRRLTGMPDERIEEHSDPTNSALFLLGLDHMRARYRVAA
jgi:hypothetical protein